MLLFKEFDSYCCSEIVICLNFRLFIQVSESDTCHLSCFKNWGKRLKTCNPLQLTKGFCSNKQQWNYMQKCLFSVYFLFACLMRCLAFWAPWTAPYLFNILASSLCCIKIDVVIGYVTCEKFNKQLIIKLYNLRNPTFHLLMLCDETALFNIGCISYTR